MNAVLHNVAVLWPALSNLEDSFASLGNASDFQRFITAVRDLAAALSSEFEMPDGRPRKRKSVDEKAETIERLKVL